MESRATEFLIVGPASERPPTRPRQAFLGTRAGPGHPLRHWWAGVKPCVWEQPLDKAAQLYESNALPPAQ